jgi:hypothetical protein
MKEKMMLTKVSPVTQRVCKKDDNHRERERERERDQLTFCCYPFESCLPSGF